MTVNKAILVGNLGQDPELRATGGGTPVTTLRIATTDRRKDRDGNWTDQTEWHSVVVFGRQAENIGKYCKKGKQLFIEGRIQTRKWQDRDGKDRYNTEIVADNVRFLGGRNDNFANLQGRLDEVALYDRALTPEEISAHYRSVKLTAASEN